MEGKGGSEGWYMLRSAGGAHDKTVIDRIMHGFRPIAPKPVTGGSASGSLLGDDDKNMLFSSKRSKRKYVRVRKNDNGYNRSRKNHKADEMVTLPLLPEKEKVASDDLVRRSESWCNEKDTWLGLGDGGDQMVVVESWVTVESVTGACMEMEGRGLGSGEVEIMKNLEKDTCPGFISDGGNHKVRWVNDAYKKMVIIGSNEANGINGNLPETVVMVSLVMKEKLPCFFSSLTCRVRVQYTWQKEKYSNMVPCDVWRMECGGFAWRLDVDAALSLGR